MGSLRCSHVAAIIVLGALLLLLEQFGPHTYNELTSLPFAARILTTLNKHVHDFSIPKKANSFPLPGVSTIEANGLPDNYKPGLKYIRDMYVGGYQYPHPELCPSLGKKLHLLILVTSAPSHFAARKVIRESWGQNTIIADVGIAFVLGIPPQHLEDQIEIENKLFGDIIIGRFIDSYSNLTLKTLSMLEWTYTYCKLTPYLLKTDDDMLIKVDRLLEFTAASERVNASRTIWGRVWREAKPVREMTHKYYMPLAQYPGDVYPDYMSGEAYMMTSDCIKLLLEVAWSQPYMRMEDVFITGILASHLNIRRIHAPDFLGEIAVHF